MPATLDIDTAFMGWINRSVGVNPALDVIIRDFADWNFFRCAWIVCILWWAWFRFPDLEARVKILAGLLGLIVATFLSKLFQLIFFVHERPFHTAVRTGLRVPDAIITNWGYGSSFPSDTATLHFALAAIVWSLSRRWGIVVFAWVAIMIALPRIYLTYHHLSDMIEGALLGIAGVSLAQACSHRIVAYRWLATVEQRSPHWFYPLLFVCTYQIVDSFNGAETGLHEIAKLARAMRGL